LTARIRDLRAAYRGGRIRKTCGKKLLAEMRHKPGYTWIKAEPRTIALPSNLVAPGMVRGDFERLTVACGLRFVNVGDVSKVPPPQRQKLEHEPAWRDNYPRTEDVELVSASPSCKRARPRT